MIRTFAFCILLCAAAPAFAAPVFGVRTDLPAPVNGTDVKIADIDGNGVPDLLLAAPGAPPTQGQVASWFGRGDGYFWAGPVATTGKYPANLAVGKLDGDAIDDFAVTSGGTGYEGTQLEVQFGLGEGAYGDARMVSPHTFEWGYRGVAIGDVTGDGLADVVGAMAATGPNYVPGIAQVCPNTGNRTFGPTTALGSYPSGANDVAIADVDGDGANDIALASGSAPEAFFLHDASAQWVAEPGPANANYVRLGLGDFDGDGLLDQAYTFSTKANVRIRLSTAPDSPIMLPLDVPSAGLAVVDLDGDGKMDLVTTREYSPQVEFRAGHGDGTFDAPVAYDVAARPVSIAAGDLNGDGLVDLAVAAALGNAVTVLLQGNPVVGTTPGPARFALAAPFPNPTRAAVTFTIELPSDDACALAVHDVRGRLVESHTLAHPAPGPANVRIFEAARPAPGIYFATLRQGDRVASKSFVVLP